MNVVLHNKTKKIKKKKHIIETLPIEIVMS